MPYIANVTVKHDGKNYQPGAEVPLTDKQAAPLLALKAVQEAEPDADKTPAKTNKKKD